MISKNEKENIKFKISTDYDVDTFFLLNEEKLKNTTIVKDFNDIIALSDRNGVEIPNSLTKKDLEKFVEDVYKKKITEISNCSNEIEVNWRKISPSFFNLASIIYKNTTLDKEYILFPSVWGSFIRDFKNKRISFPYNQGVDKAIFVIAHELLHIIFYKYLYENHPQIRNLIESKKVWDFSEVINVIIQEQEDWISLFITEPGVYQGHEDLYKKMSELWKDKPSIDIMIEKFLY